MVTNGFHVSKMKEALYDFIFELKENGTLFDGKMIAPWDFYEWRGKGKLGGENKIPFSEYCFERIVHMMKIVDFEVLEESKKELREILEYPPEISSRGKCVV